MLGVRRNVLVVADRDEVTVGGERADAKLAQLIRNELRLSDEWRQVTVTVDSEGRILEERIPVRPVEDI